MNLAPSKTSRLLFLWLVVDDAANVVDKFVQKIEHRRRPDGDAEKYWNGGVGITPLEQYLQNQCWRASPTNFVNVRDSKVTTTTDDSYKIQYFLEFCPFGDLYQLFKQYEDQRKPIPEPAIWMLLQKLAEQCLIMQQGSIDARTAPPSWHEIAHRDIKPDNVFLGVPTQGFFNKYPTPKMADFGLAVETRTLNDTTDTGRGPGTANYKAPEQVHAMTAPGARNALTISSYTNIFGIGLLLLELVNRQSLPSQKDYKYGPDPHEADWRARRDYTKSLIRLIMRCLEYDPLARIMPNELLREAKNGMRVATKSDGDDAIGWYCTRASNGKQDDQPVEWQWETGREQYKVMMAKEGDVNVEGSWAWIRREMDRAGELFARTIFG